MTRLVQCFDVGKAINPTLVEGQIEGGAMMGLGLGVLESCYPYYPSRRAPRRRSSARTWRPGMEDLPQIDTIIIENPSADGPYGAKGIGEMANNPQPPAIAAAVHDAVGVWITELPITPERVLRALEAKARAAPRRQEGRLRRGALGEHASADGAHALRGAWPELVAVPELERRRAPRALPGRGAPRRSAASRCCSATSPTSRARPCAARARRRPSR